MKKIIVRNTIRLIMIALALIVVFPILLAFNESENYWINIAGMLYAVNFGLICKYAKHSSVLSRIGQCYYIAFKQFFDGL